MSRKELLKNAALKVMNDLNCIKFKYPITWTTDTKKRTEIAAVLNDKFWKEDEDFSGQGHFDGQSCVAYFRDKFGVHSFVAVVSDTQHDDNINKRKFADDAVPAANGDNHPMAKQRIDNEALLFHVEDLFDGGLDSGSSN